MKAYRKRIMSAALAAALALGAFPAASARAFADDYEPSYSLRESAAVQAEGAAGAEASGEKAEVQGNAGAQGSAAAGQGNAEAQGSAAEPSARTPGTIRYEEIPELVAGSGSSELLDKKLKALQDPDSMTVFTRDSIVYQIKLSKVERQQAEAEMIRAAQQAYTGILRLDDGIKTIEGSLAAAERTLASLTILRKYGMASQLQLDEAQHAIDLLEEKKEASEAAREALARQLGFLCGTGAVQAASGDGEQPAASETGDGTDPTPGAAKKNAAGAGLLFPAAMPAIPSDAEIGALDPGKDLPEALAASFDIRLKKEAVSYAEGFQGERAESAAKADRLNTEEKFRIAFEAAYRAIAEKQLALRSAKSALTVEEGRLSSARLQHAHGTLSRYALLDRERAAEEAGRAVRSAELDLLEAVEVYRRMVRGLSPESSAQEQAAT